MSKKSLKTLKTIETEKIEKVPLMEKEYESNSESVIKL